MEISLIGKRVRVPKLVSDWLDFDRAFSAKVMAGEWENMRKEDLVYAAIQTTLAVSLVGCAALGRDQKTPETPTLAYSPSEEIVPVNMFGQDALFYTAQPAFVELGLSARQVEVVQLGGSNQYTALQLMEIQDKQGEIFYNLMFQNKNGQVKQEWAVLLADSPQSPESVLYQLDLVSENGHNVFVANMAKQLGNLTLTQLQINLPGETGIVPVPTADLIGLFSGAQPVLANVESTSTPAATLAPTPKPTATLTPFPTPTEMPTLVPTPKPGEVAPERQEIFQSVQAWLNPNFDFYGLFDPTNDMSRIVGKELLGSLVKGGIFSSESTAVTYLQAHNGYLPDGVRFPYPKKTTSGMSPFVEWRDPDYQPNLEMPVEIRFETPGNNPDVSYLMPPFETDIGGYGIKVENDGHIVIIVFDYDYTPSIFKSDILNLGVQLKVQRFYSSEIAHAIRVFKYYGSDNAMHAVGSDNLSGAVGTIMIDKDAVKRIVDN